jgi:hypothetical protein
MAEVLTTIPTVMKWTDKLCPFFLKWYYTEKRLEPLLLFDVLGCGDAISYNFHSQEGTCYLAATNLSPFAFTVDRIQVDVVLDTGGSFKCSNQFPQQVKGNRREMIYLRSNSSMTPEVAQFAKNAKRARVEVLAHIVTNIRSFQIRRYIEDIHNVHVNA